MTDIVAFLTARLDEAAEAAPCPPGTIVGIHDTAVCDLGTYGSFGECTCTYPAFAVADIAAKRRIIDSYRSERALATKSGENAEWESRMWLLESVLHNLAAPFADHPDYEPAWNVTS